MQEPFPDPRVNSQEEWNSAHLWRGSNCSSAPISYEQMRSSWDRTFRQNEIKISKQTHTFRILGVRICDNAGLDAAVSTT
jgi:hypothetical protein